MYGSDLELRLRDFRGKLDCEIIFRLQEESDGSLGARNRKRKNSARNEQPGQIIIFLVDTCSSKLVNEIDTKRRKGNYETNRGIVIMNTLGKIIFLLCCVFTVNAAAAEDLFDNNKDGGSMEASDPLPQDSTDNLRMELIGRIVSAVDELFPQSSKNLPQESQPGGNTQPGFPQGSGQ